MKQTFIEVNATFTADGKIIPKSIVWGDKRYPVDRVTDIRRSASTKAGGAGLRYTCQILGKERFLYFDDTAWFVAEK